MIRLLLQIVSLLIFTACAEGAVEFTNIFAFPWGGDLGGQPQGKLVRDVEGNLYGTTGLGGKGKLGTVFKMTSSGKLIWSFSFTGKNGSFPGAGLFQDRFGFLYGTTTRGGRYDHGTIFKFSSTGRLIWSESFDGSNGSDPEAELTATGDGDLYSTTAGGGAYGFGTVYKVDKFGRIRSIYSFSGNADGAQPVAGLTMGNDGYLYGTTMHGGLDSAIVDGVSALLGGNGTVFKITPAGRLTTIYSFGLVTNIYHLSLDGSYPAATLTEGKDHALYGTTLEGGDLDQGTVFKMKHDGSFDWQFSFNGTNGSGPLGKLIEGLDGNLYGTTQLGGDRPFFGGYIYIGAGTIFRMTPNGVLTTLYSFGQETDALGDPLDGAFPQSGLTRGNEGDFYGVTMGGFVNPGQVFRLRVSKPIIAITEPGQHANQTIPGIDVLGKTKAKMNTPVADVLWRLNHGAWTEAVTTDSWTNWTATVMLTPGVNVFQAYAIDATGDVSRTNTLKLNLQSH
jgi:uncharacterized repeat protein (TIGR03803 family)